MNRPLIFNKNMMNCGTLYVGKSKNLKKIKIKNNNKANNSSRMKG